MTTLTAPTDIKVKQVRRELQSNPPLSIMDLSARTAIRISTVSTILANMHASGEVTYNGRLWALTGFEFPKPKRKVKSRAKGKAKQYPSVASLVKAAPVSRPTQGDRGTAIFDLLAENFPAPLTIEQMEDVLHFPRKHLSDALYQLRIMGRVARTSRTEYTLAGPYEGATKPIVIEGSPDAIEQIEVVDLTPASEPTVAPVTPSATVSALLDLAAPNGLPATTEAAQAALLFSMSAEHLVRIAQG